jgi:hypothetical protein
MTWQKERNKIGALVPYFGGKSRLAKTIISKFPEHTCYVEVFAGGASVFFAKEPSKTEVLNDLDKDLVTLYRAVKNHPEELHRQFKFSLVSRSEFEREKEVNAETLTDIPTSSQISIFAEDSLRRPYNRSDLRDGHHRQTPAQSIHPGNHPGTILAAPSPGDH